MPEDDESSVSDSLEKQLADQIKVSKNSALIDTRREKVISSISPTVDHPTVSVPKISTISVAPNKKSRQVDGRNASTFIEASPKNMMSTSPPPPEV